MAPTICTLDTASSNWTLERIEQVLDPADVSPASVNYRLSKGLTGLSYGNISIVTDSSRCAAGLQAFAKGMYPTDSANRNTLRTDLTAIFMV